MSTNKILEHNVETGEAIEREMTVEELSQLAIQQAEEIARIEAKEAAIIKLAAIGLTPEDLKVLGL